MAVIQVLIIIYAVISLIVFASYFRGRFMFLIRRQLHICGRRLDKVLFWTKYVVLTVLCAVLWPAQLLAWMLGELSLTN